MNIIESIPQTWDDGRDVTFFSITGRLFGADFTYGAGVLLATYDAEDEISSAAEMAPTTSAGTGQVRPASTPSTTVHLEPWSAA